MITCPLCGYEFDYRRENCHAGCPFNKGCAMIMCPGCGYEWPMESKTVALVKTLLNRLQKKKEKVSIRS